MIFKGLKNIYVCATCGHGFVSLDLDAGTTPFTTCCLRAGCKGLAQSMMYPPQHALQGLPHALEWYKPDNTDGLKPAVKAHVEMGGLISRRVGLGAVI